MKRVLFTACLLLCAFRAPANSLVQFRTYFGDIELELFDQQKPITVGNFLRYARAGLYQDGFIHRCDPAFVIQGGGFFLLNRADPPRGYSIPTFAPIPNEYGAGTVYSNLYGTIAMAKMDGDTNSATSQWFINLNNNWFLDAHDTNNYFTVFGRVIRGSNVLNQFKTFSTNNTRSNIIGNYGGNFKELPLLTSNMPPQASDFIFVDVSLLSVQVRPVGATAREISWNSVIGKTNYVEYTTNLPALLPSWQNLFVTNGTGSTITVQDANASAPRRFYRVRVLY